MIIDDLAAPVFTNDTFDLLAQIAQFPTAAFYLAHKAAFKALVEEPLRRVMRREAVLLPRMMRDRLETERNVFSRFLKNDFGQGGAWSNYWGAFYPRGSRRIADVQLAVWMNARRVGISFYIGDYAVVQRERFSRNCARWRNEIAGLLGDLLQNPDLHRAGEGKTTVDEEGRVVAERPLSWEEWLDDPRAADFWVFHSLTPEEAVVMSGENLARLAARTHTSLFPLALLAMEEEPLPLVRAFLGEA